jgi:Family of unknown function (DUF5677)
MTVSTAAFPTRVAVLIGVLLRQVIAMLDGIDILLSNGATYASHLQMRALFEASVYIDWILQGDFEKKIDYFYVHNVFWAARTQPRFLGPVHCVTHVPGLDPEKIGGGGWTRTKSANVESVTYRKQSRTYRPNS